MQHGSHKDLKLSVDDIFLDRDYTFNCTYVE